MKRNTDLTLSKETALLAEKSKDLISHINCYISIEDMETWPNSELYDSILAYDARYQIDRGYVCVTLNAQPQNAVILISKWMLDKVKMKRDVYKLRAVALELAKVEAAQFEAAQASKDVFASFFHDKMYQTYCMINKLDYETYEQDLGDYVQILHQSLVHAQYTMLLTKRMRCVQEAGGGLRMSHTHIKSAAFLKKVQDEIHFQSLLLNSAAMDHMCSLTLDQIESEVSEYFEAAKTILACYHIDIHQRSMLEYFSSEVLEHNMFDTTIAMLVLFSTEVIVDFIEQRYSAAYNMLAANPDFVDVLL